MRVCLLKFRVELSSGRVVGHRQMCTVVVETVAAAGIVADDADSVPVGSADTVSEYFAAADTS